MTAPKRLDDKLRTLFACDPAVEWANSQDPRKAWYACDHGDWLLWLAATLNLRRQTFVRAACACARTALQYVPDGEDRPRIAIKTAERWCDGKATLDEVRKAAAAADANYAAAYAAGAADDAYAAYAAACAARAAAAGAAGAADDANAAAYAANAAAYAADAAAYAADDAAYAANAAAAIAAACAAAARRESLKQCADIVREHIPWRTIRAAAVRRGLIETKPRKGGAK
jgi:hypothetical protein